jgi:hypothetical protein
MSINVSIDLDWERLSSWTFNFEVDKEDEARIEPRVTLAGNCRQHTVALTSSTSTRLGWSLC